VAGQLCFHVRRKKRSPNLGVTSSAIKGEQFLAKVNDLYIHVAKAEPTAVVFRRIHERRSQPGLLSRGIYGEQPEIRSVAAWLDVHAAQERGSAFNQEERSGIEEVQDAFYVNTISLYKKRLSAMKGGVDNARDPFRILAFSDSHLNSADHGRIEITESHPDSIVKTSLRLHQDMNFPSGRIDSSWLFRAGSAR